MIKKRSVMLLVVFLLAFAGPLVFVSQHEVSVMMHHQADLLMTECDACDSSLLCDYSYSSIAMDVTLPPMLKLNTCWGLNRTMLYALLAAPPIPPPPRA